MKDIKNKIVNSSIVGFCVSGMLTNTFCIYTSLVFHDNDDLENRVLFVVSSLLLAVYLLIQSFNTFNRIRKGETIIRNVLKETVGVVCLSVLWMIPFWMVWAWIKVCVKAISERAYREMNIHGNRSN